MWKWPWWQKITGAPSGAQTKVASMAENFWQEFHYPVAQPGGSVSPTDGLNQRTVPITVNELVVSGDLTGDFDVTLRRANAMVFAVPLWTLAGSGGHLVLPAPVTILAGQAFGIGFVAKQAGLVAKFKAGVVGTF